MYLNQKDVMVRKEQNKDLLRDADRERLAGAVETRSGIGSGLLNKVVAWFSAPRASADPFPASPTLTPASGQ